MSQLRGTQLNVDFINTKSPTVSGQGATYSLNENQSGSTVVFDRTQGQVFTLPARPTAGTYYDFISSVNTSTFKVIANIATATSYFEGSVRIIGDTNGGTGVIGAGSCFVPVLGTDMDIAANGGTTGGRTGSYIRVSAVSAQTWFVTGVLLGTGTLATPFTSS